MSDIEPLTDKDPMPFGKHKGARMKDVPASWLDWADGKDWLAAKYPRVKAYIRVNRAVINLELKDKRYR